MKIMIISILFLVSLLTTKSDARLENTLRLPIQPTFKKVFIIVLENEDNTNALNAPYLKELASRGAYLSNFHGLVHPSQGNYFALTAGSYLGMKGLLGDRIVEKDVPHIADLLEKKGLKWKSYAEDYPGNCYKNGSSKNGQYVRRHEPFISFVNVASIPIRCASIVNATELEKDISANALPDYSLYVPNIRNDGHDTNVAFASRWLQTKFDPLFKNQTFMKDLLVIVTFDESLDSTPGNPIYTMLYGDSILSGSSTAAKYDHYNILRTIEDVFELGSLHQNDEKASPIAGIWK